MQREMLRSVFVNTDLNQLCSLKYFLLKREVFTEEGNFVYGISIEKWVSEDNKEGLVDSESVLGFNYCLESTVDFLNTLANAAALPCSLFSIVDDSKSGLNI